MNRFVEEVNERGADWYIKDGQFFTKMKVCECPMLEAAKISGSVKGMITVCCKLH